MKYIALLRGINVGGHKKILMADLRDLLSTHKQLNTIKTYIQSGNVIFESDNEDEAALSLLISELLLKKYKFNVPVQVYSKIRWNSIVKNNPFINKGGIDTKRLNVTILDKSPKEENIAILKKMNFNPDTYIIDSNIIYCHYPNGVGRSKMTSAIFERKLNVSSTSRNWNTMLKIKELLSL